MGRRPCCSKVGMKTGAWTAAEDKLLSDYILLHGEGGWRNLPKTAGLKRCGKSCRLRWLNYLRPDIKRGNISDDEEDLIIRLHKLLGNRWSLIAGRLPGRTDNEIKNYWNTTLRKKTHGNHTTLASSSKAHTKQCNKKKMNKKVDKVDLFPQNVESSNVCDHVKALNCSDQFPGSADENSNHVPIDLVPADTDLGDISLTELLDYDLSGSLGTESHIEYEMEHMPSWVFSHDKTDLEEFWSVDEQNLYSNLNLYSADCVGDWLFV
ncbi:hypothetical protein DCAR_0830864 [Daucus carota subsp. sativus]|uniref:Myb-related protein 123 n=1 Tax=Daucus carota subsp. sativus TaxID=79200 RepID=A0A175YKN2_DAUCS|nr:PREDICTED: transcription factor MYB82-like [Daucus carota subsp. sativus]WOH11381.1 hypothetical protein DCAR_0830864 [Daucus carota subsp. sativus]